MLATLLGILLLLAGGFIAFWAVTGPSGPPAEAQQIPAAVGTAAPRVGGRVVARALAASAPVRIEIPVLSVDAPVTRLGLNSDGSVQVPPLDDHNLAGWYTGSVTPGQSGASVLLGHVDSWSGGSVFFKIKNLRRGDTVDVIRADGDVAVFTVDGLQKAAKVAFPTGSVYSNPRLPGAAADHLRRPVRRGNWRVPGQHHRVRPPHRRQAAESLGKGMGIAAPRITEYLDIEIL